MQKRAKDVTDLDALLDTHPEDLLILDIETTGFGRNNEILQVAIMEAENGTVLFDSYVKPQWTKDWYNTQKVNGITPVMVHNAPSICDIMPTIRSIVSGKVICAYNMAFDQGFMPDNLYKAHDVVCLMRTYQKVFALPKVVNLQLASGREDKQTHSAADDCDFARSVLFNILTKNLENENLAADTLKKLGGGT